MKKIKSRYTRFKDGMKQKIGVTLGSHGPAFLPESSTSTGSLNAVPQSSRHAITPLSSAPDSVSRPLSSAVNSVPYDPPPREFVPSDNLSNTKQNTHAGTRLRGSVPTMSLSRDMAPDNITPPLKDEPSTTKWPGLKLLLAVLDSTAEVFLPFKAAIEGLNKLVKALEGAVTENNEYSDLRTKLDSLLEELGQHIDGMTNPRMSTCMKNLCVGIGSELQLVEQKLARGMAQRYLEAVGEPDQVLECYRRIYLHLERLKLNANLSVWETVDKLDKEARLRQLLAVASAAYNSAASEEIQRRACTEGTRKDELTRLLSWARNKDAAEVYWMNGMAGTGKTTIAYSLCADLEITAELAATFFCSRQIPECRDVKLIIPAIAYQLARFSLPFCHALLNVLDAEPDVHTRVLKTQFEHLLIKPLLEVEHTLPTGFVVVIDALDECENQNSVGQILDILLFQKSTRILPIRFLLSSRPEPQIYSRMITKIGADETARLILHELDETKVQHDIKTYLETELEDVHLAPSQLVALVAHVGVLFIYASTSVRYIKDGMLIRQHETRLNTILGLVSPSITNKDRAIDTLYMSILRTAFDSRYLDEPDKTLMKELLDTIICAREPLTLAGLAGLLSLQDDRQVDGLLRPLRSVVHISEASGVVNTLHASFPDFMREHERSASFHCDLHVANSRTAQACFRVLSTNEPQFNICRLKSSHVWDGNVLNRAKRADQAISSQLFYACRYWAAHMKLGEEEVTRDLMYHFLSEQLLLWMEVLNLKECMHLGPCILHLAAGWSSANGYPKETVDLAHDAWRFVTMYTSHDVSKSTPHIYVSMLPFWPESAPVTTHYAKRMHKAVQAKGSAMTRRQLALLATWPLVGPVRSVCFSQDESVLACAIDTSVYIMDGTTGRIVLGPLQHTNRVKDVEFSHDGVLLVSCSDDTTVKVWNTRSGQLEIGALTGHTDYVNSISLLPFGERVVSGSRDDTIRVWSLESGHTVLGPIQTERNGVWCTCVSSDGARIATGHGDGTIHIWDAGSGRMLSDPLLGHTDRVKCTCFSPDNTRLVSGSRDRVVRLWSNLGGQVQVDVLQGHTDRVESVAFSPDGKQITSGSADRTVRIWNVEGTPQLVRVLKGHINVVRCVRFLSNGTRIVSCSSDGTIRVWDVRSNGPAGTQLEGQTEAVTSVAFSSDAARILSGSNDGVIHIWDAQTRQVSVGPIKGHTDLVTSVCFSPDQSQVASGSRDKTVQLWDAHTGQAIGRPLAGHSGRVVSVCFSPNGALLASGSEDKTIRLWHTQSGDPAGSPLIAHTGWVYSVSFSPDSQRVISSSEDKSILVWDVNTRKPAFPPLTGHDDQVRAVCVSPDGTLIASGANDTTVRLWSTDSGQCRFGPLLGHRAWVRSVCFSPDGSYVVSGSDDKAIRLWDAQSGQSVGDPLIGHIGQIHLVAFSINGSSIISGSNDLSIRVWDVADLVQAKQTKDDIDNVDNGYSKLSRTRQSWDLQDNGWVVDSKSRLLAWVPPDLHTSVMNPRNSQLLSAKGIVQLDFDSAKLGESWTECYKL